MIHGRICKGAASSSLQISKRNLQREQGQILKQLSLQLLIPTFVSAKKPTLLLNQADSLR